MDPPNIPMIAYIFMAFSVGMLTYVTYSDDINKIPNAIAETTSSVVNSTANSIKNATSSISTSSITGSTIPIATQLSNLMPDLSGKPQTPVAAPVSQSSAPVAAVAGGNKKSRRTKKKNTKKNKSTKK